MGTDRRLALRGTTWAIVEIVAFVGLFVAIVVIVRTTRTAIGVPQPLVVVNSLLGAVYAILAAVLIVRFFERRSLVVLGFDSDRPLRRLASGAGLTIIVAGALFGLLAVTGGYRATTAHPFGGSIAGDLLYWLANFLFVAVFEEIAFRGIVTRLLERVFGTGITLVVSAVAFGAAHAQNQNSTIIGVVGTAAAGLLLSAVYLLTRSLWIVIGIHWAWNMLESAVFGVPVSGQPFPAVVLNGQMTGPSWWNGGTFGPECGLAAMLVLMPILFLVLRNLFRSDQVVAPIWRGQPVKPTLNPGTPFRPGVFDKPLRRGQPPSALR